MNIRRLFKKDGLTLQLEEKSSKNMEQESNETVFTLYSKWNVEE